MQAAASESSLERRMRAGGSAYSRQGSTASSGSGSSSPRMSPGHRRSVSNSSISGFRRVQNLAAKAANARLARVMALQAAVEQDDEDILDSATGTGVGIGKRVRFGLKRAVVSSNGGGGATSFERSARFTPPAVTAIVMFCSFS